MFRVTFAAIAFKGVFKWTSLNKHELLMSGATPKVALSFRDVLVKILKAENDGVLEFV